MSGIVINVKELPLVPNICRQILREVYRLGDAVSVAHVEMKPGGVSLLHRHRTFTELYYVLSGKGLMYVEGRGDFIVMKDMLIEIKPGMAHNLKNTDFGAILSHLVISTPTFNPDDLEVDVEVLHGS